MLTIPSFAPHREASIESARSSIRQTAAREHGTAFFDASAPHHLVQALAHDFTLVVPPKVERGRAGATGGGEPKQRGKPPERGKNRDCGEGNSGERRGARSEFAAEPPRMRAETDMEPPWCLMHQCRSIRWVAGPAAHTQSHSHDGSVPRVTIESRRSAQGLDVASRGGEAQRVRYRLRREVRCRSRRHRLDVKAQWRIRELGPFIRTAPDFVTFGTKSEQPWVALGVTLTRRTIARARPRCANRARQEHVRAPEMVDALACDSRRNTRVRPLVP